MATNRNHCIIDNNQVMYYHIRMIYELIGSLAFYILTALLVWKVALSNKSRARQWVRVIVMTAFILMLTGGTYVVATHIGKSAADGSSITHSAGSVDPPSAHEILTLVNKKRAEAGIGKLTEDTNLDMSATAKAKDMSERGYFSHTDPSDSSKHGYELALQYTSDSNGSSYCSEVSENIYTGTGAAWTSAGVVNGWMGSKPHREAILNTNYSRTGIGIYGDKVVEHFCVVR